MIENRKQKLLLLGANGFIGIHLKRILVMDYDVIEYRRSSESIDEVMLQNSVDIIVNCSVSKPTAISQDSFDANIGFQMKCLVAVMKSEKIDVKWIQVASYFELQIPYGRKDYHTTDKQLFRILLNRMNEAGLIQAVTIFLPHVFGEGENPNRIIPYISKKLKEKDVVNISKGEQFIPLLGVSDTCFAITAAIKTTQIVSSATPIWYGRVKELAKCMLDAIPGGSIELQESQISIDNFFPKVEFPPTVNDWAPKFTFTNFISELKGL